jgi:hypothetical protein
VQIDAKNVRYIKLGRGGRWVESAFARQELQFGESEDVPHEISSVGDRVKIKNYYLVNRGRSPQAAAEDAREIIDFYTLGEDCLWITFARDHLWWTFAEPLVTWIRSDEKRSHGERIRKCISGWRNTDVKGNPLRIDKLSTRLTKIASYRRTICSVEAREYLLRRLNGMEEPIVASANQAREALLNVVMEAISTLHENDFETLVDVIFARSGWHRASAIGGTQKLIDLVLEQPTTAEQAAVQVKSTASQKELESFINDVDQTGLYQRLFFVCHSPKGVLETAADRQDIHVWWGRELAKTVLRVGLADWVVEKVS